MGSGGGREVSGFAAVYRGETGQNSHPSGRALHGVCVMCIACMECVVCIACMKCMWCALHVWSVWACIACMGSECGGVHCVYGVLCGVHSVM